MDEEMKTSRPADSNADSPEHRLAAAFEELVAATARRRAQAADSGGGSLPDAGPCPEQGEWLRLACGETPADEIRCAAGSCSGVPRLCDAAAPRASGCSRRRLSPEEEEELGKLASASPQWQHRLAVELAHTASKPPRKVGSRLLVWAGTGLAAALAVAAGSFSWWQYQNTPERLLAEAYTHDRIFDLRIPGAAFTPVTPQAHLRGGAIGPRAATAAGGAGADRAQAGAESQ